MNLKYIGSLFFSDIYLNVFVRFRVHVSFFHHFLRSKVATPLVAGRETQMISKGGSWFLVTSAIWQKQRHVWYMYTVIVFLFGFTHSRNVLYSFYSLFLCVCLFVNFFSIYVVVFGNLCVEFVGNNNPWVLALRSCRRAENSWVKISP